MKKPSIRFLGYANTWEQRKFTDGVSEVGDGLHGTPTYCDDGCVYFVNGNNLVDGRIVINADTKTVGEDQQSLADKSLDDTTILMSINGTIGNLAYYSGEKLMLGKSVAYIKVSSFDKAFVYACLQASSVQNYFMDSLTGTTIKNLGLKAIREMNLLIPLDVDEQEKIGLFFSNLDNLITLHQRKLYTLKNIKGSLIQKLFPKEGSVYPEIRFVGYTDEWIQCRLGDIVDRVTRKNENNESELPLTISAQYGLIDQMEFFDKRIASRDISGYYLLLKGEFAYNKSTSSDAPWGAVKRLDRYKNGAVSTLYITFAIKDLNEIDSDFLTCYYDTNLWHKGIQAIAAEGARNHGLLNISPDDFFNTTLMIPSNIEEQKAISSLFITIDNLISFQQRECDKLIQMKAALLQKMFV